MIDTETGAIYDEEDAMDWEEYKKANSATIADKKPEKNYAKFPDGTKIKFK